MKKTKDMLKSKDFRKFNLIALPTIDLMPQEADHFIDCIWDESVMKGYARLEKMLLPTKYIRHIGFGEGKFLFPADEFDESKYKKQWEHNRITLTSHKIRGCVAIYDDDLEENIEGARLKAHFMQIITKQIANELEVAYYMGDTTGTVNAWCPDDIEHLWDGWRYIINHSQVNQAYYNAVCGASDIKDACDVSSGAPFVFPGDIAEQNPLAPYNWEFKYHQMIKNMPSKYKQRVGLANMVFMNSDLVTQDYIAAITQRPTPAGDAAIVGKAPIQYGGVPIISVPLMPTNLGNAPTYGTIGAGDYTDVILTPKGNFIIGIQKSIKIEPQRSAGDECTYYFYTLKVALAIENVNAIVFVRCLTHQC